jgi:hypothetical protein
MVKFPEPVAALIAKAASLRELHPEVYRAVLVISGVMLIIDGLTPDRHRDV